MLVSLLNTYLAYITVINRWQRNSTYKYKQIWMTEIIMPARPISNVENFKLLIFAALCVSNMNTAMSANIYILWHSSMEGILIIQNLATWQINTLNWMVTICISWFKISNSAFCIYSFHMILTVNSINQQIIVIAVLCSVWGTDWILKCYLDKIQYQRGNQSGFEPGYIININTQAHLWNTVCSKNCHATYSWIHLVGHDSRLTVCYCEHSNEPSGFHKRWEISWQDWQLSASQEGLSAHGAAYLHSHCTLSAVTLETDSRNLSILHLHANHHEAA
jgi:hypothetical protein